jgi:hypothetical protein
MLPYSKCEGQYVANPSTAGTWGSQNIAPAILKPLHKMEARGQNQAVEAWTTGEIVLGTSWISTTVRKLCRRETFFTPARNRIAMGRYCY